eukprot:6741658-Ditylum_brightwellii.AAC.1
MASALAGATISQCRNIPSHNTEHSRRRKSAFLDTVDPIIEICLASDILLAWQAEDNVITGKVAKTRKTYWEHWKQYISAFKCSLFLTDATNFEQQVIITAFAALVRTGLYGCSTMAK